MRRDRLKINRATGLKEIKQDLRQALRDHHTLELKNLESVADDIYAGAISLVPYDTGELEDSIQVDVSTVPRYPGIIAIASARNVNTNYDYAFLQEVNEEYRHAIGRQAHYLEEPFRDAVRKFYKRMGWK